MVSQLDHLLSFHSGNSISKYHFALLEAFCFENC